MATVISVNGQDGAILARSTGLRLVQEGSQALVLHNEEALLGAGRPGQDAPAAVRGEPAGALAVRLSESNQTQGAIRVESIAYQASQRPPGVTEVPIGRDILLTAIGGDGESGHDGGDGQRGLDGFNGADATTASDATNGTDGGSGGDAGRGSSGADGGPGGTIHIVMRDHNTHLLMAVSCDVRGGQGGLPGKHGIPGAGGTHGKGGKGWQWTEIIGYKKYCTDSCIRSENNGGNSTALVRTGTMLNAGGSALVARMRATNATGSSLQDMVARTALRYNAMTRQPARTGGYCKCGGGDSTASCTGCGETPIIKTFQRKPGLNGKDGKVGASITTRLVAGNRGETGEVKIVVQRNDGSTQEYLSPWSLELADFDVEDENGDGIFEPGEHIIIRRIRIRNVGGMPSPTCRIPVTLSSESDWFESVAPEEGGLTFLPSSIPSGGSASTEGFIKVKIKNRPSVPAYQASSGVPFTVKDRIGIRADMPWLDRRIPFFDFTREIEISYPCSFGNFWHLDSIAQGRLSVVQFEVQNKSHGPLGVGETGPMREVEVQVTIPRKFGRLVASREEVTVSKELPYTRPRDSAWIKQLFRVLSTARSHAHFPIRFELYLESPGQDPTSRHVEKVLIEWRNIRLQVSNIYTQNSDAEVLLITNNKTTEPQSLAIQNFVRSLNMEMDLCNVQENGGLLGPRENEYDAPVPITTKYVGKTVIVLDNTIDFLGRGERSTSQLFDPNWLSDLASNDGSCIFTGCEKPEVFDAVTQLAHFSTTTRLGDAIKEVQKSRVRDFSTAENPVHELIAAIQQEKPYGHSRLELAALPLSRPKWYRMGRDKPQKQAKDLARHLRHHLPNERFLVSFLRTPQDDSDRTTSTDAGYLIVLPGLDNCRSVASTAAHSGLSVLPGSETHPANSELDNFSKYLIISALPFRQRIRKLWSNFYRIDFVNQALTLSIIKDIHHQITTFTSSRYKRLINIDLNSPAQMDTFLQIHLHHIYSLFADPESHQNSPPPTTILQILRWTISLTSSLQRHRRLHNLLITLLQDRPSTRDLYAMEAPELRPDPGNYNPDALFDQIAQLCQKPKYEFTRGIRVANHVVGKTRYCPPGEWDELVRRMEEWREGLKADMEGARDVFGRMLGDSHPMDAGWRYDGGDGVRGDGRVELS